MLILPDGHYAPKVLLPQPREYWNPSLSLPRDGLGNPVVEQHWRLTARLHDGHIVWRGRFDDRDDADAFLWAMATGSLQQEPALWRLPTPAWHPGMGELLEYDFTSPRFVASTSTSNQTDTLPSDWNPGNNQIEVISHAGTGGSAGGANNGGGGGGGGGYALVINAPLAASSSQTFHLEAQGVGNTTAKATWYGGTTLAGSQVGICGGTNGALGSGGAGASTASAIGSTKFVGGNGGGGSGGGCCDAEFGGGGGGAAGPHGAGGTGGLGVANSGGGAGGTGDNGNTAGNTAGTQWDGSHGSGGGGLGGQIFGDATAGANYGGGGGGVFSGGGPPGVQGLIVQTYTPGAPFIIGYIPMLFIS